MIALLVAWPAVALAVAVFIGRCIRDVDNRERPTQRDMGLAA